MFKEYLSIFETFPFHYSIVRIIVHNSIFVQNQLLLEKGTELYKYFSSFGTFILYTNVYFDKCVMINFIQQFNIDVNKSRGSTLNDVNICYLETFTFLLITE